MKTLQATMSRTDLLLRCPWAFGREVPHEPPGEAAEYGTAFHKDLANLLTDRKASTADARVLAARKELAAFLGGRNAWGRRFAGKMWVERSIALNMMTRDARFIPGPNAEHYYEGLTADELPGTADLVVEGKDYLVIVDHKTGREVPPPAEAGQLKSLAAAFYYRIDRCPLLIVVAFLHAPIDGPPVIYADSLHRNEMGAHTERLESAFYKIGNGSLTPGDQCTFCPARMICPTQTNALAELKAPQGQPLTVSRIGAIHQQLQVYNELAEKLREQIREGVRQLGPAPRPDGKVVDFVVRPYSNLSQASIKRAIGVEKGEKLIADLRKMGCIEEGEREELRATNERGR